MSLKQSGVELAPNVVTATRLELLSIALLNSELLTLMCSSSHCPLYAVASPCVIMVVLESKNGHLPWEVARPTVVYMPTESNHTVRLSYDSVFVCCPHFPFFVFFL